MYVFNVYLFISLCIHAILYSFICFVRYFFLSVVVSFFLDVCSPLFLYVFLDFSMY